MSIRADFLVVASWTMLVPIVASAQAYPPGAAPNLDRRVFVDVNRVTPSKVLDELSDTIACTLDVDKKLPQPEISLRLANVRARTALDAVCDMVGCKWTLKGATLVVTATAPPPALDAGRQFWERAKNSLIGAKWKLNQVPLRDVLAWLSQEIGADIVFEGIDPSTPITEDLRGLTGMDGLSRIGSAVSGDASSLKMRVAPPRTSASPTTNSSRYELRVQFPEDQQRRRQSPRSPLHVYEANERGLIPPKVRTSVRPEYTREAMQRRVQGQVVVVGVVEVDGTVRDISVTQPLDPELDARAIAAAGQWLFTPGMKDGKPVPVRITLELTFNLK